MPATPLKTQLGLGDLKTPPSNQGSTEQADKFKAAYQAHSSKINESLQYTAAYAEKAKHDPLAAKRETLCQAYQVALQRIDPTNPAVAQSAIDQVLASAQQLQSSTAALKTAAEKAYNAWTAQQANLERLTDEIREMNEWGHEKAVPLQSVLDAINAKGNERAYEEALKVLDQLASKETPIYEDYKKQKAAQEEYEQALGTLLPRLESVRQSLFKTLEPMQKELAAAEEKMKEAAGKKDFVSGLAQLRTIEVNLGALEAKLKELEEKKQQFEAARGPIDEKIKQASAEKFDELAVLDQEIADLTKRMDEAVTADDYATANTLLGELSTKADEKTKQVDELKAKKEYETAEKAEESHFSTAELTDPDGHFELKNFQTAYKDGKKGLDTLVTAKDYKGALAKLPAAATAAKDYIAKRKGYDTYKSEYAKVKADIDYVKGLRLNCPPNATYDAELTLCGDMINNYEQGKFDEAVACMKTLQGKVADLKKRIEEHDKTAKPAADAAEKQVQDLAGGKKISELSTAEREKLVKELKKLPLDKQQKILADLHGPSGKLTAEQRQIQIAMYHAMELDPNFKEADAKVREKYQEELQKDPELKSAMNDWNKNGPDGKPLVDNATKQKMFEKILAAQSKAYGIDVPKVEWYDGDAGDFGGFSADTTRRSLNRRYLNDPKEMVDTILHENTHNFQDELVKRFIAGKIPTTDPMYNQAKTFAITHHWDAYVKSSEDGPAYKAQPEEMQAWEVGGNESKKLIKSFKKKPSK